MLDLPSKLRRNWFRLPQRTVRVRLTLTYGSLFLLAGMAVLGITYLLVDHATSRALYLNHRGGAIAVKGSGGGQVPRLQLGQPQSGQLQIAHQLLAQANAQHDRDLHQLLVQSAIALGIVAIFAVVLGWLVAGRVLRPLRVIQEATLRIGERNLHERLALAGPKDEIKNLADTIDGLLARLEGSFIAQRHFVANASHELRTPLTLDRTLIEVALADPNLSVEELRGTLQELLASAEQQERLIDALLTLATSERGLDRHEEIHLAPLMARIVDNYRGEAQANQISVCTTTEPGIVSGSPDLLERMLANLIENAIRHNTQGGWVTATTGIADGRPQIVVENSGHKVDTNAVGRLFQPFERIDGDRATYPDGHGLGLSIVRAITAAHGGAVSLGNGPPLGGAVVTLRWPTPA